MFSIRSYPSLWNEFLRLQKEMENFLGDTSRLVSRRAHQYPTINVWANTESAMVTAEIPGIDKDDIEVNVIGDTLSIKGSRKPEELPENAKYHRQEIVYGDFQRTLQLPYTIDAKKVKATFKHGILTITLPRLEAEKPKKITVKGL